jgi:hypothetical protein
MLAFANLFWSWGFFSLMFWLEVIVGKHIVSGILDWMPLKGAADKIEA